MIDGRNTRLLRSGIFSMILAPKIWGVYVKLRGSTLEQIDTERGGMPRNIEVFYRLSYFQKL